MSKPIRFAGRRGVFDLGSRMSGAIGYRAEHQLLGVVRTIGRYGRWLSSLGATAGICASWKRGEVTLGRRSGRIQFCSPNWQRAGCHIVRIADRASERFSIRRSCRASHICAVAGRQRDGDRLA